MRETAARPFAWGEIAGTLPIILRTPSRPTTLLWTTSSTFGTTKVGPSARARRGRAKPKRRKRRTRRSGEMIYSAYSPKEQFSAENDELGPLAASGLSVSDDDFGPS